MKNAENNISIPASVNIKIQEKTFWNMTVEPGELRKPYRSSWEQYHWEKIFEEWLAKRVRIREMVGLDLSGRMIDLARRRCNGIENVHFLVADLDATPFPDRRFDVCVVIDALHHLPDEFRTLKELSRVSTDLVLSEPNALNPIRRLNERKFRKELVTERSFYKSRIVGAIKGLGYDRVAVRNCHFIPSFMPTFLLSLLRRCELFLERAPILKEFSGSLTIFAYRTFPNPNTIRFQRSE